VAAPVLRRTAATARKVVETHRVTARIGFVIEFLASKCAAAVLRRSVRWDRADLKREEVRGNGKVDRTRRE
jgi:hypothetical protein